MKEIIFNQLNNLLITAIAIIPNILAGVIVFTIIIYLGRGVNKLVGRFLRKSDILQSHFDIYLKISKIFFLFIATILFLNTVGLKSVATGLFAGGGIIAVISGFAFKEIGENIFAGILLSFNRPFQNGDTIRSGEFEGSVQSIEIRSTHIKSANGQDIFIPSAQIYKNTLINLTREKIRRYSLNIGISYDDDIDLACDLIAKEMEKINSILKTPKAGVFVNKTLPTYIELVANFWIDTTNTNSDKLTTQLLTKVKSRLAKSGLTLSPQVSNNVNFKILPELSNHDGLAH